MTRHALVVAHRRRPEAADALGVVVAELVRAGLEPVVVADDATEPLPPSVELVVVLGGDGTILRAAELTRDRPVPILAANLGRVGFLASVEPDDLAAEVRRFVAGEHEVEERSTIEIAILRDGTTVSTGWALNEAALEKADPTRMLDVGIEVDGHPLQRFGCDGVVVATPTGSTAHAFSGGGPVVWPDVEGTVVVPVAAHALFTRPLVVGPTSVVSLVVLQDSPTAGLLTCDGRRSHRIEPLDRIEIRRSPTPVRLARLAPASFTTRLVHKFALPVDGWRRPNGGQA